MKYFQFIAINIFFISKVLCQNQDFLEISGMCSSVGKSEDSTIESQPGKVNCNKMSTPTVACCHLSSVISIPDFEDISINQCIPIIYDGSPQDLIFKRNNISKNTSNNSLLAAIENLNNNLWCSSNLIKFSYFVLLILNLLFI